MRRVKVTLAEFFAAGMGMGETVPLVSGYLKAYACSDSIIQKECEFSIMTFSVLQPAEEVSCSLLSTDADVFGLSSYMWNARLVKSVVRNITNAKPQAVLIVGGPQAFNRFSEYAISTQENLLVCNGWGELPFKELLQCVVGARPFWPNISGISLFRDGEVISTQPKVIDINDIPSPWLEGHIDLGNKMIVPFETTRGCPYSCSFCANRRANDRRIQHFDSSRIKDEITFLAQNGVREIAVIDSNWGMFEKDLEFTRHLCGCKKRFGSPRGVGFQFTKEQNARLIEIAELCRDAGFEFPLLVALQTLYPPALAAIRRRNATFLSLLELQHEIESRGFVSCVDLIWPLPKETNRSFYDGIQKLCEAGVRRIKVFNLVLLNGTELDIRRDEFGLKTEFLPGGSGEYEMVVATEELSRSDVVDGMWFVFGMNCLFTVGDLYSTARYLDQTGKCSFQELFGSFAAAMQQRMDIGGFSYVGERNHRLCGVEDTLPGLVVRTHHLDREKYDAFLYEFIQSQPWFDDDVAIRFEIDALSRPYFYQNTPFSPKAEHFRHFQIVDVTDKNQIVVEGTTRCLEALHDAELLPVDVQSGPLAVVHDKERREQFDPSMIDEPQGILEALFFGKSVDPVWKKYEPCAISQYHPQRVGHYGEAPLKGPLPSCCDQKLNFS